MRCSGLHFWAVPDWSPQSALPPAQLGTCTEFELVCAGSWQQLSKQPKAKTPNHFKLLSGESYNQHKQKPEKKYQKQHWALLYHLDCDHESLLRIRKDRKLKTKTTISVLNYNHDYFCKNYACFYKGRIAEDYHFACYWDSPEKQCFKDLNYITYPKYYIPSIPS